MAVSKAAWKDARRVGSKEPLKAGLKADKLAAMTVG